MTRLKRLWLCFKYILKPLYLIPKKYNSLSEFKKFLIATFTGILITLLIVNPISNFFNPLVTIEDIESVFEKRCKDTKCSEEERRAMIETAATMSFLADEFYKRAMSANAMGRKQEALFFLEILIEMEQVKKYGDDFWIQFIDLKVDSLEWRDTLKTLNELNTLCNDFLERDYLEEKALLCILGSKSKLAKFYDNPIDYEKLIQFIDDNAIRFSVNYKLNAHSYYIKAITFKKLNNYKEAITAIRKAMEIYPNNWIFQAAEGRLLYEMRYYDEAYEVFTYLIKNNLLQEEVMGEYNFNLYLTYYYLSIKKLGEENNDEELINKACARLYHLKEAYDYPFPESMNTTFYYEIDGEKVDFICDEKFLLGNIAMRNPIKSYELTPFTEGIK